MNTIVEDLLKTMPESPTELSSGNIKRIHSYLPVPNDFSILWADITAFAGYPAGVVIADKGIIFKASRQAINENKSKENKREKDLKVYYSIILWEYFSPDQYAFELQQANDKTVYVLKSGDTVISMFENSAVYDFFSEYGKALDRIESEVFSIGDSAAFGEVEALNFEQAVFNAAYGANQNKTGHGIYAEEGSTILDKLSGDPATVVGRDNAKNGPDKLVNGRPVQCKFCQTASASVGACFKDNPQTGIKEYRYYDLKSGRPMQVEVPSDQYEKAVQSMQNRIKKGQVPGVSDPEMAKNLVRKSRLTYNQARNLAKAGTFESLTYDVATGVVSCTFAAGISSLVSFGLVFWKTKDPKKAQDAAIDTAIQVFGPAFAANLISNQLARTGLTDAMVPLSERITEMMGDKAVSNLINAKRALLGQSKISAKSASKNFAKAFRTQFVSEGTLLIVFSVPDTYRLVTGKISGAQYTKNMVTLAASFLGNLVGNYAAGAIISKIGYKVNKKYGGIIGFFAGLTGASVFGVTVKKLTGLIKEDDSVITARLINAVIANMAIEYFLSEKETSALIGFLNEDSKEIGKLQRKLITSENQYQDVENFLTKYYERAVGDREIIRDEDIVFIPSDPILI